MVISFSVRKPREHLLKLGRVYTARKKRRKKTGYNWWTTKRGEIKAGDVDIVEVGQFKINELRPYVDESGFKTLRAWGDAIAMANRWKEPRAHDTIWLYQVHTLIPCPRCNGLGDVPETEFSWLLCPRCKGKRMIRGVP